jgi:hypothetical protein
MKVFISTLKILALFILIGLTTPLSSQTPIKRGIFGQNAWWINMSNTGLSNINWAEVAASGVTVVRIGGIEPNFFPMYDWYTPSLLIKPPNENGKVQTLITLINTIRGYGMDVMIQVGYNPVCHSGTPPSTLLCSA